MDEYGIPKTIRIKYNTEKHDHDDYCCDGYISKINKFTLDETQVKCPFCMRFKKEIFEND